MKRNPEPLVLAWLIICLVVVLGGATMRTAPVERAWVLPLPGGWFGADFWLPPLITSLAVAAAGILALGIRRARPLTRTWGEILLFFPLLFGFFWFVFPVSSPSTVHWLGAGFFLATAAWLVYSSPESETQKQREYGRPLPADILLVGGPVLIGVLMGTALDLRAVLFSMILYPFYSGLQLAVFLFVPARRLRSLGLPDRSIAVACAVLFALAHWPNPLVMAATFLAMFLWAGQHLRGRPLRELVLVMAITATGFSQFLPDEVTRHMRVGPGFIRREAIEELSTLGGPDLCETREFMTSAYPLTIGRPIFMQELDNWLAVIHRARRHSMAWQVFISPEYANLAARNDLDPPPAADLHWTDLPTFWHERFIWYGQDSYWDEHGRNQEDFVASLYQGILGRERGLHEGGGWTFKLNPDQRLRLAEIMLERRLLWHRESFQTMSLLELRLP